MSDSANHHAEQGVAPAHLLELFRQAPGFLCFLRGRALVFELANPAYLQLVGHRDLLGRPLREALPELAGQGYFELLDQVVATGEPFVGRGMRVTLQREPGASLVEAFVDFVYQPIRGADGAVAGILVQGNDVTEARREEALRRAAEERYRTLFESIDDGFCIMQMIVDARGETVDYRFLEANAAFEGHTGLVGAVGRTARELVPDLDASWFERYGRVAATGESARFESHAPAMGRWFEVYASRVGTPALRQVALVFKDVTDRRRAEAQREGLLALESAARREAEEASRLKDEFLATVSHELRTPLAAILGWTQMLRGASLPPDRRDRALETIERNARAQAQLIEDLLDVSRILAGKLRLEAAAVDLRAVVDAAVESVRPAAEAKGLRLEAELADGCSLTGDAHRLQQVAANLLSNAVKFTPAGGAVRVELARRGASVELTVRDDGVGIAPSFLPHVFERFRQADGATTRSHGGLGLGLSIVRHLVEMHGGAVAVASEGHGRGACFTVTLPAGEPRPTPAAPLTAEGTGRGAASLDGVRVLVVDDEADAREMLRVLLEGYGARVAVAASAAEALRCVVEARPDVLVSDIGMPGEDGYALVARLRALPAARGGDVPAVALTAYTRAEDQARALAAGFDRYLARPVEPAALLEALAALAARAR